MRSVCCAVCCVALCCTSQAGFADTNDVADILAILQAVYRSQTDDLRVIAFGTSGVPLSSILKKALSEGWTDTSQPSGGAYLYQIRNLLRQMATNTVDFTEVLDYFDHYAYGADMWHVHLDDDQLYELVYSLRDINATMENGFDALSESFSTGLSSVDLTPVTSRQDAQYDRETYANTRGQTDAATLSSQVAQSEAEDWDTISDTDHDTLQEYESEPTMPDYTPASDHDTADANKDSLLDSLGNDALSHTPVLTLVSAADFLTATGVSGSMQYNLAEGPVYTFVGNLGNICSAAWYGLLAVFSALLFWRKQNEISGIVRATNFSRV